MMRSKDNSSDRARLLRRDQRTVPPQEPCKGAEDGGEAGQAPDSPAAAETNDEDESEDEGGVRRK